MMNIHFKLATTKDAKKLTSVSIKSFHTDFFEAGRKSIGGPPGYDSRKFHEQMIYEASKFYKIIHDGQIIGGFWFFKKNTKNAYLYRIFIDPKFNNKGIGSQAFNFLFHKFPTIKEWSLQTPNWNTRTPKFYVKLGFKNIEKSERFLLFKRQI